MYHNNSHIQTFLSLKDLNSFLSGEDYDLYKNEAIVDLIFENAKGLVAIIENETGKLVYANAKFKLEYENLKDYELGKIKLKNHSENSFIVQSIISKALYQVSITKIVSSRINSAILFSAIDVTKFIKKQNKNIKEVSNNKLLFAVSELLMSDLAFDKKMHETFSLIGCYANLSRIFLFIENKCNNFPTLQWVESDKYNLIKATNISAILDELYKTIIQLNNLKIRSSNYCDINNRLFENLNLKNVYILPFDETDLNKDFIGFEFKTQEIISKSKSKTLKKITKLIYLYLNFELKKSKLKTKDNLHKNIRIPFLPENKNIIDEIIPVLSPKKMETRRLQNITTELKNLNSTKDKFFSIIAHDLKNPFHQILGFTDILLENFDDYEKEQILEIIGYLQSAATSAYKLLENLLEWARTQTGRIKFEPEYLTLYLHIDSTIDLLNALANKKQLRIISNIDKNVTAFADKDMFDTIIRNLISNAIKFSDHNNQIIITSEKKDNFVYVSVIDFGIGISKEIQDTLFKLECTQSSYGTDNEHGTGLGLILCKEFVTKHGGKIFVKSEPAKGSVFTFSLPTENIV